MTAAGQTPVCGEPRVDGTLKRPPVRRPLKERLLQALLSPIALAVIAAGLLSTFGETPADGQKEPKRHLVWSEDFNRPGQPDPAKWDREVGSIRNHEMQFYTRD